MKWLTIKEAMQLLGKSESTLRKMVRELKNSNSPYITTEIGKNGLEKILIDERALNIPKKEVSTSILDSQMIDYFKNEIAQKNNQIDHLLKVIDELQATNRENTAQVQFLIDAPKKKNWRWF